MIFKLAFDGENGMEVMTIDTEVDYGTVPDSVLELADCVSPISKQKTEIDDETVIS